MAAPTDGTYRVLKNCAFATGAGYRRGQVMSIPHQHAAPLVAAGVLVAHPSAVEAAVAVLADHGAGVLYGPGMTEDSRVEFTAATAAAGVPVGSTANGPGPRSKPRGKTKK